MVKHARRASNHPKNSHYRVRATTKAGRIYKKRFVNKPVARKMRKPRATTVNQRQTQSIYTLGRQVRALQMQRFGQRQFQFQSCMIRANTDGNTTQDRPTFFPANAFYNDTLVLKGTVNAGTASFSQLGTSTAPIQFKKQAYDVDLDNQYDWQATNNQDTVSKDHYLPVYMSYKFRFRGRLAQTNGIIRYRITFVKCKRMPVATTVMNYNLPSVGGAYWHLCDDNPNTRNHFSKSYHEVLADRWVTFHPPSCGSDAVRRFDKLVRINYAFPGAKTLRPEITTAGTYFWTNVPSDEIIWCIISTNVNPNNTTPFDLSIERGLTWRDPDGGIA